ncbi:MAG: GntR family transcriptional regulator [Lachnospiraceae bacterium]|nr:GntR family transcriptional regulator [Lachnospiraceae bacterium]
MDKTYFKNTFHFSSDTSAPLYLQLASYIRIQIQAGVLKPGDKMIAENDLCEILNVSRTTIRQCMNQLTEEGHIVRYRGKGSFIADQKLKRPISYLYDFTENMLRLGASPTSEVLISEVTEPADDTILSTLQMPMGQTRAFHLLRLRCANGDPILLENTYIPYYLCPGINITRISHLDSGYVFEYTTSVTRADKCVFQLDLYKNSSSNKNPIDFHRQISL